VAGSPSIAMTPRDEALHRSSSPWSWRKCLANPSAIGLLQVLPEQTNTTSLEGYRLSMGSVEFFNLDLGRELV